jgi:predicted AAA+ superfamily ATPase
MDNGLVNAISFRTNERFGKLMENLVAVELLRRKKYWYNSLEIYYWKDYQQNEVDIVLKEGAQIRQLIQVTYTSSKNDIDEREIKGLVRASDVFMCKDLLIITWDYEDVLNIGNKMIKCVPLWKWLLNKNIQ